MTVLSVCLCQSLDPDIWETLNSDKKAKFYPSSKSQNPAYPTRSAIWLFYKRFLTKNSYALLVFHIIDEYQDYCVFQNFVIRTILGDLFKIQISSRSNCNCSLDSSSLVSNVFMSNTVSDIPNLYFALQLRDGDISISQNTVRVHGSGGTSC